MHNLTDRCAQWVFGACAVLFLLLGCESVERSEGGKIVFDRTAILTQERFQPSPAIGDLNGDGLLEFFGGVFVPESGNPSLQTDSSLSEINDVDGRWRDNRLADLNGDGNLDVVANTYCSVKESDCIARLFIGKGDGSFQESPRFRNLKIRGHGETILAADFDNDEDLDLFIPHYSHNDPTEHSYLLINDGQAHFTDISDSAGVALRNVIADFKVEGAQALDFDEDGWIDFYVASHLFRNNGDLTFTDIRREVGLPERFDEGIRFMDWNNDGNLDLILQTPYQGPALFEFSGHSFQFRAGIWPVDLNYARAYGLNTADLDNDGLEDVVIGSGLGEPKVFRNTGSAFELVVDSGIVGARVYTSAAFGDLNQDGRLDVILRVDRPSRKGNLDHYVNESPVRAHSYFTLEVLGADGRQTQGGRVVRIWPENSPGTVFTRVVESGSGFLSQNQYPILVGTPYSGSHAVSVRFSDRVVGLKIRPGEFKQVLANGRVIER